MNSTINIYCDESCHLEHDQQKSMVLGAVWCPASKAHEIAVRLREIKQRHKMAANYELKWVKVSPAKYDYYLEVLDYFFDDDDINFRALIVPDKSLLRHQYFGQDHDTWYYKMYFSMLKTLLKPDDLFKIYLDLKDTRSAHKTRMLHDVLCNKMYDFRKEIIQSVQIVRSSEIEQIQLADLLIGIVSYVNRGLSTSTAKNRLVERMRARSHYSLTKSTLLGEKKVNLFVWQPKEVRP